MGMAGMLRRTTAGRRLTARPRIRGALLPLGALVVVVSVAQAQTTPDAPGDADRSAPPPHNAAEFGSTPYMLEPQASLAASAPPAAQAARPAGPRTFAAIEIDAHLVKAMTFTFSRDDVARVFDPNQYAAPYQYETLEMYRSQSLPARITAASFPENTEQTADAVRRFRARLTEEMGVAPKDVMVMVESGLGRMAHAGDLAEAISRRSGLQPAFLTPEQEGAHAFDWATPVYRRHQAAIIDVGATNITAGYQQEGGRVVGVEVAPYGVNTVLNNLVADNAGLPPQDLENALRDWHRKTLAPLVYRRGLSHPALLNRPRLYLSGGIVSVMMTIAQPQRVMDEWVEIRPQDIRRFSQAVASGTPFAVDVSGISDPNIREQAAAALAQAQNMYTPDQLTAGAQMLQMLAVRMNFSARDRVFFARIAQEGWQTQHLLTQAADRLDIPRNTYTQ